jgi:hypothetical protein
LIERYREVNERPDLFGNPQWKSDKGTVAVGIIDGVPVFGVNSTAPTSSASDLSLAASWRDHLIRRYPDDFATRNIGQKPNDALYHAEAMVLMRAAIRNGGSLKGRTLKIYTDREMCDSCDIALPFLGMEMGNPKVTFVNLKNNQNYTMHGGRWHKDAP